MPDTDTDVDHPYRDTGKTCLGGGMCCLSASSYKCRDHRDTVMLKRCGDTLQNNPVVTFCITVAHISSKRQIRQ